MKTGLVKKAKIMNVISAVLMVLSGLLLILLSNMERLPIQRILLSLLFFLTGAAKLLGYFSNDLYRLAFQFDFAVGIFCGVLALLVILTPESFFNALPTVFGVYVILDALFKLQISIDARKFGMANWPVILLSSLLLLGVGLFVVFAIYDALLPATAAVGIALVVDGLQNVWITAYTVRVRARKKNLSEHFGLDEEENEDHR